MRASLRRKKIDLFGKTFDGNFIIFNKGTLMHELSMNACKSAGFESSDFLVSTIRVASIISMVSSITGVALLMEKIPNYYHRSDVVALPLDQMIEYQIVVAYLN